MRTPLPILLGALAVLDIATSLQLVGALIMLIGALAIGRTRQKDATIKDLESALKGKEERLEETQAQLAGASARADTERERRHDCENEIAARDATITELRQYTAKAALGELKGLAERLALEAATRHTQLLEHMNRNEHVIVTALSTQGDLILKNTALASAMAERLQVKEPDGPVAPGD